MRGELHYDAVVIGAGTAGLVAGTRLAQGGARGCVLAKGVGSSHLAPGTIGVLGYAPDRVQEPGRALERLIASRPDHPYTLIGADTVTPALEWFQARVAEGPLPGYQYVGSLARNQLLPTAVGALRPSALVPETMAGGDAGGLKRVCVVGTRALRDFHPSLCAANLQQAEIQSRAGMAIRDPHGAWSDMEHRLGRRVFEIPTLPPSVPGMRLFEILRSALRSAGGRLVLGPEVVAAERDGARLTAVRARAAGHDTRYVARWIILASGGFASGGIELDSSWVTHERVLGLALHGVPATGEPRFSSTYLQEQPIDRVGVAVDSQLRAEGMENVLVAGAALPGAVPWREGSGEGIALASGYRVAQTVLSAEGAREPATAAG